MKADNLLRENVEKYFEHLRLVNISVVDSDGGSISTYSVTAWGDNPFEPYRTSFISARGLRSLHVEQINFRNFSCK